MTPNLAPSMLDELETPAFIYSPSIMARQAAIARDVIQDADLFLAMKAFALRDGLERLRPHLDGLHVSSLFEARLAKEMLSPEQRMHFTSPGLRLEELEELVEFCDMISVNSLTHWERYRELLLASDASPGLRINPRLSLVNDERYDPSRRHSKLGASIDDVAHLLEHNPEALDGVEGLLVHTNCDSKDLGPIHTTVEAILERLGPWVQSLDWLNLGGGYLFEGAKHPEALRDVIDRLRNEFGLTVVFEPGSSLVRDACILVSRVVDLFESEGRMIAVLDTSTNHLPEVFEYQYRHKVRDARKQAEHAYTLAGSTCLAGDIFGTYAFDSPLELGSFITLEAVGSYSMVKASMFNGQNLPTVYRLDDELTVVKRLVTMNSCRAVESDVKLYEEVIEIPTVKGHVDLLEHFASAVADHLPSDAVPIRFVVSETTDDTYHCEIGVFEGLDPAKRQEIRSIFDVRKRLVENTEKFNAVFLIPTGIGCELGGHAGDANAAARLVASACDTLITHPNVVNASDINELPENGLYVEGSVISRLMMGTVGLQPVRANRVLAVIDDHPDTMFTSAAVNAVSAARASYGLTSPPVIRLDPPVELKSTYSESGRAAGEVHKLKGLLQVLDEHRGEYDAVALSTQIKVPFSYHTDYFEAHGEMLNPWGGVEAIFTHAISELYDLPAAHAPMLESREVSEMDPGEVDPRMAAEAISLTFFMCVLKGLQRSPKIVQAEGFETQHGVITAEDISCLIIPDKAVGLPTLAALEQGIPVIAVRENRNILNNDLAALPWKSGQLIVVENYWEAVGVMEALKAGIDPMSVRRPLPDTQTEIAHTSGQGKTPR